MLWWKWIWPLWPPTQGREEPRGLVQSLEGGGRFWGVRDLRSRSSLPTACPSANCVNSLVPQTTHP